jgi:hypothetical protein
MAIFIGEKILSVQRQWNERPFGLGAGRLESGNKARRTGRAEVTIALRPPCADDAGRMYP